MAILAILGTLYIRRRSQLLREHTKVEESAVRKQYLKVRSQLLQKRYGVSCDQGQSSRTMSIRSNSRISESPENSRFAGESKPVMTPNSEQGEVVPTKQADASRAIVGGTTIAENYAFVANGALPVRARRQSNYWCLPNVRLCYGLAAVTSMLARFLAAGTTMVARFLAAGTTMLARFLAAVTTMLASFLAAGTTMLARLLAAGM
uniref:Uncharacterized protein n=1 Tax=Timema monikensis TaxID=170555 RepID=A0A7R9EC00_9NEOP|nr:unnamed protein product [Timema monikensis]